MLLSTNSLVAQTQNKYVKQTTFITFVYNVKKCKNSVEKERDTKT